MLDTAPESQNGKKLVILCCKLYSVAADRVVDIDSRNQPALLTAKMKATH